MITLSRFSLAALSALALAVSASALTITPSSGVLNTSRWSGPETSQSAINTVIAPIIGSATELYKQDVGQPEAALPLASSYQTTFSNTPSDPSDAKIVYTGGQTVGSPAFALVKDGNQNPGWYLFNLTLLGWNGTADLEFQGFWPNQGAISHISLYGTPETPGPRVPDGGSTVALLGAVIALLAFARRQLS
jgi:hypothetical protein